MPRGDRDERRGKHRPAPTGPVPVRPGGPRTADKVQAADVVITMGCGDACPVYLGKRYLDWDLPDPAGLSVEQVRPIRDDISHRVEELLAELVATQG